MKSISFKSIVLLLLPFHIASCGSQESTFSNELHQTDFRHQLFTDKNIGNSVVSQSAAKQSLLVLKNPTLGTLFSAVIPGTGEIYAGSWLKGAFFFGAEIAFWLGYKHYNDKGQEWDKVFHVFADQHWSEPRYWVFIAQHAGINGVTFDNYTEYLNSLRSYEREHYSHSLHEEKDQQYYEMIGKYDQFRAGWDDIDGNPVVTPNRNHYLDMRNESNINLKRSSACVMGVLANHVLSAFDAAWTIKGVNKRIETRFRIGLSPFSEYVQPWLSVQLDW